MFKEIRIGKKLLDSGHIFNVRQLCKICNACLIHLKAFKVTGWLKAYGETIMNFLLYVKGKKLKIWIFPIFT